MTHRYLPYEKLDALLQVLTQQGYHCIGPQVKDGVIVYDSLSTAKQLPWGVREQQQPGSYRLEKTAQQQAFGWANGPQALKPLLFKSSETLWRVMRDSNGKLTFKPETPTEQPMAVIGVRACDIAGLQIQDKTFLEKGHIDKRYQQRRNKLLLIAVECTYAAQNCFCVSAGTGPWVKTGYDLKLTELGQGFVVSSGTDKGLQIIDLLKLAIADPIQISQAQQKVEEAAQSQAKQIPLNNSRRLRDVLFNNLEHPRWEEVASRCLSCTNCTQVCPTCFCHEEKDLPNLEGSEHQRLWDSCFTAGHSYVGGKVLRDDTQKRYRQWLTHKVGSWHDQYGTSGCVGCGRCISWCPVGIDLTEELAAITGESNLRREPDAK